MSNIASSGDGLSVVTLAAAMKYTKETAEGMGAVQGKPGRDGKDGESAYQIAVDNGFVGSEQEWLASLIGPPGIDGVNGKDGKDGKDGQDGAPGAPGKDGETPYIGDNGHWWIGDIDTGVNASGGSGEGTFDHRQLSHRDANEQHPIDAITDLRENLDSKLSDDDAMSILDIIRIMEGS